MWNRKRYEERKSLTGEALLKEIEKSVERSEQEISELEKMLNDGQVCFHNTILKQEAIVHPSSKQSGNIQFSYFDELGAVGDIQAENEAEMAKKIHEYGFMPCDENDFKYSILAKEKTSRTKRKIDESVLER